MFLEKKVLTNLIATDKFTVWVPSGRAISPITKTNWEGTGVVPHINTTSKKALDVAHLKALEVLLEKTQNPDLKFTYQWSIAALKAKLNPIQLDHEKLKSFVGNYQSRVITFKSGTLFYQKDNGIIYELLPYSNNEFMLKNGSGSFRIRFITDGTTITAMEGLYNNGHTSLFNKTIVP